MEEQFSFLTNVSMNSSFLGCVLTELEVLGENLRALSETRTRQLWSRCLCIRFLHFALPRSASWRGGSPGAAPGLRHTHNLEPRRTAQPQCGGGEAGCTLGASHPRGPGLGSTLPGPAPGKPRPWARPRRRQLARAGATGSHPPRGLQTASESREGLEFFPLIRFTL